MAKNLSGVTLTAPSSDPNINEGGNFNITCTGTYSGGGGVTSHAMKAQYSTNDVDWNDITGATPIYISTGHPVTGKTDTTAETWTAYSDTAGTYYVRVAGDRPEGGAYEYFSSSQQVTVNSTTKASSGDPSIAEVTASGSAKLIIESSGSPAIDEITASGKAGRVLDSSGSPAIDAIEASGDADATSAKTASGSPSIATVEASGTAEHILPASGSPSIAAVEASGTAGRILEASGSPSISGPTPTGKAKNIVKKWLSPTGLVTAEYGAFTKAAAPKTASGSPAINEITASGTAENVKAASGSPSIDAVEASGTAAQTYSASGSPSIDQITASGTAEHILPASGSPSIDEVTASGTASQEYSATGSPSINEITASGTATLGELESSGSPSIDEITASGSAGLVLDASGSPSIDEITASGTASQELSATGSPSIDTVTASGTAGRVLAATGSPTLDDVEASGTADAFSEKAASGSPSIDAVTASGTATKISGVTTQRNMGPHGLTASYPDVLREFDTTAPVVGRAINADSGNVTVSIPTDLVQLGPHGLVTFDRQFSPKGVGPVSAYVNGAQINLEWNYPDSADAAIYTDGEDVDGNAGSVVEAEAQVGGTEIQALAGTSTSAVSKVANITGAKISVLTSDSTAVPGTGATPDGAAIVAQAATPSDIYYGFAVTGMIGAQINSYHAEVGWDTNFDVGVLVYGEEIVSGFGTVTQETRPNEQQQGSWMGGGGGKRKKKRKKFKKRKFHMPLAGVKLRDRPFENPVIEEEIEQIVDDVIEAAEELEAKGYAEAISADIIAEMARLKAATDEALIRGIRNTEAVSRKLAEAKLGARINELVRRRRAYIRVEHERILRDQRERARQQELERKRQREYEIRKARAEWRAELLLNQPIEPYEEPTIDDEADVEVIMQLMEEIL